MIRISYVSDATRPMTGPDLDEILAGARDFNTEHGLTGLLLYAEGRFLQAVEGESKAVMTVMSRVRLSTRHTNLRQAPAVVQSERQFPSWAMGFENGAPREVVRLVLDPLVQAGILAQAEADAVLWARFSAGAAGADGVVCAR